MIRRLMQHFIDRERATARLQALGVDPVAARSAIRAVGPAAAPTLVSVGATDPRELRTIGRVLRRMRPHSLVNPDTDLTMIATVYATGSVTAGDLTRAFMQTGMDLRQGLADRADELIPDHSDKLIPDRIGKLIPALAHGYLSPADYVAALDEALAAAPRKRTRGAAS